MAGATPTPVFYTPAMVADSESFSPSAGKPALVIESWQRLGLPLQMHTPLPLSAEQFSVAHDPAFVADILGGRADQWLWQQVASGGRCAALDQWRHARGGA